VDEKGEVVDEKGEVVDEKGEVVDKTTTDHFRILYPVFSIRNVHHDTARKHAIRVPRLR